MSISTINKVKKNALVVYLSEFCPEVNKLLFKTLFDCSKCDCSKMIKFSVLSISVLYLWTLAAWNSCTISRKDISMLEFYLNSAYILSKICLKFVKINEKIWGGQQVVVSKFSKLCPNFIYFLSLRDKILSQAEMHLVWIEFCVILSKLREFRLVSIYRHLDFIRIYPNFTESV